MSYLDTIHPNKKDPFLKELKNSALKKGVPIITDEGLRFLSQIIKLKKIKNILEIGSAIGYSAIAMAKLDEAIIVDTIERNPSMQKEAAQNIEAAHLNERIHLIKADALNLDETTLNASYDLLFIDGAKAQSIPFFKKYASLVKKGGIVIADNLLFHGFLEGKNVPANRNTKQLVKKIDKFNQWVLKNPLYDTAIYKLGDGMSLSIKRND